MKVVIKGNGIKLLDSDLELASYQTLLANYSSRVELHYSLSFIDILLKFQEYIYEELDKLHIELYKNILNYKDNPTYHAIQLEYIELSRILNFYKNAIDSSKFMLPSQILKGFERISILQTSSLIKLK
jgi:hypothetical protein